MVCLCILIKIQGLYYMGWDWLISIWLWLFFFGFSTFPPQLLMAHSYTKPFFWNLSFWRFFQFLCRLLKDHTDSSGIHSHALSTLKSKLEETERKLQRELESHQRTQVCVDIVTQTISPPPIHPIQTSLYLNESKEMSFLPGLVHFRNLWREAAKFYAKNFFASWPLCEKKECITKACFLKV